MPAFGVGSLVQRATIDPVLRQLVDGLIAFVDFTILPGARRTLDEERALVAAGKSTTLNSKHIANPATGLSDAVDIAPYPQKWDDSSVRRLSQWQVDQIFFAGIVRGYALARGIPVRLGADWNGDTRNIATGFMDLDHVELVRSTQK